MHVLCTQTSILGEVFGKLTPGTANNITTTLSFFQKGKVRLFGKITRLSVE